MKENKRKILCNKGTKNTWTFYIPQQRNPCDCGSNCFHEEYDGENVICVCNACNRDIYEIKSEHIKKELERGDWIEKKELCV